jgi:dihydrofolate reductase
VSAGAGRRLILHMSVSLDGFAAHRDHRLDWLTPEDGPDHGDQRHRINLELLSQIGLIVLGRRGYEDMVGGWAPSNSPMAQYRLTVHPVALGDGLPLMHGLPEPQRFEMVSSTVYSDGSNGLVLRPL